MGWQGNLSKLGYPATVQGISDFQLDYNMTVEAGLRPGSKLPEGGNLNQQTKYQLGQLAQGLDKFQWECLAGRAWRKVCRRRRSRQALREAFRRPVGVRRR